MVHKWHWSMWRHHHRKPLQRLHQLMNLCLSDAKMKYKWDHQSPQQIQMRKYSHWDKSLKYQLLVQGGWKKRYWKKFWKVFRFAKCYWIVWYQDRNSWKYPCLQNSWLVVVNDKQGKRMYPVRTHCESARYWTKWIWFFSRCCYFNLPLTHMYKLNERRPPFKELLLLILMLYEYPIVSAWL